MKYKGNMKYQVTMFDGVSEITRVIEGHLQQISIGNETYKVLLVGNEVAYFESLYVKIEEFQTLNYLWCSDYYPTENQRKLIGEKLDMLSKISPTVNIAIVNSHKLSFSLQIESAKEFVKFVDKNTIVVNLSGTKLFKSVVHQLLPNNKFIEV